jgi:hypothetical protein
VVIRPTAAQTFESARSRRGISVAELLAMQKTKPTKLTLQRQLVRVLSSVEVAQVQGAGRPRTQPCCDLRTELLNPFTNE